MNYQRLMGITQIIVGWALLIKIKIERRSIKWAMSTNIQESMGTWILVGIAQVNLGSIGGWKPAMPTLQNATWLVGIAQVNLGSIGGWKPAMPTLLLQNARKSYQIEPDDLLALYFMVDNPKSTSNNGNN
ncbi:MULTISPECIES: hypothetical protein [unclassified Moorena]|uniref:hypothetical protein n=1 Tax=unclassified Moorena TaxID=2683338 RepID=UPI0013B99832|nr:MULTISPECIES: hypothetical protein [unclassified Moorena]NEP34443.1 hypothetical protein [Moorena sp. SIO3B2]NEQ09859.1 hypothetical protein [Moorena sp. SIO4E2]